MSLDIGLLSSLIIGLSSYVLGLEKKYRDCTIKYSVFSPFIIMLVLRSRSSSEHDATLLVTLFENVRIPTPLVSCYQHPGSFFVCTAENAMNYSFKSTDHVGSRTGAMQNY
jgi:hypothetical protein